MARVAGVPCTALSPALARAVAALALASLLAGQQPRVSPTPFTGLEGNGATSYPFSAALFRFQQIHADLRGGAAQVAALAWRRDAGSGGGPGLARTVDLDLTLAEGDAATAGPVFAANALANVTTAVARKNVALPDWRSQPPAAPASFTARIALDAPWTYGGSLDLLWEVRVFANSAAGDLYLADYGFPATPPRYLAATRARGSGCQTNSHPGLPMTLSASLWSEPSGLCFLQWFVDRAPSQALGAAVLLGVVDPDLPVPGFCASGLRCEPLLVLPPAAPVGANGACQTALFAIPWDPSFRGATLTSQALAYDAQQPGLPLAGSNGLHCDLPYALPPTVTPLTRVYAGHPLLAQGALFRGTGGLVTRFE